MTTSEELLQLLHRHWTTVATGLDDDELRQLADVLAQMRERAAADDPPGVARAVRRLRRTLSALPPEHPVCAALGGHRYAAGARELPSPATIDAVLDVLGAPPPDPGDLLRTARLRLLAAPALTEAERAALPGGQGDAAGLIGLRAADRTVRYPRFQFRTGTAEPLPVVRRINALLRADRDPWGAADWWLGGNRWLGGVPAELLGALPDDQLERAAAELVGAL
ncbi:hypothetical protein [Streptomyces similanensis]|uniref:DUF2384 domain-containing protein n=1 Tax=Streptomyces similanensis TaxID=1274988 RepID=A0ABP9JZM2_9ACTN